MEKMQTAGSDKSCTFKGEKHPEGSHVCDDYTCWVCEEGELLNEMDFGARMTE